MTFKVYPLSYSKRIEGQVSVYLRLYSRGKEDVKVFLTPEVHDIDEFSKKENKT